MKSAGKTTEPEVVDDPETRVQEFIAKFDPDNQAKIRAARKALQRRFPAANELVYDNYNFFVIGYSPTERPSDSIVSLAAGASGVGLSFYWGARLPDPHKLLLGSGTQNRFIRLDSARMLARPEVEALISAAIGISKAPLQVKGKGKVIIRAALAKHRPRRKTKS